MQQGTTGGPADERINIGSLRCEHVSSLSGLLGTIIGKSGCRRFVLLLDGIDELREGGQMLLAALCQIGQMVCRFALSSEAILLNNCQTS